jgi:hypothetical protein
MLIYYLDCSITSLLVAKAYLQLVYFSRYCDRPNPCLMQLIVDHFGHALVYLAGFKGINTGNLIFESSYQTYI